MTRTGDEPVGVLYERSLTGDPDSDASWERKGDHELRGCGSECGDGALYIAMGPQLDHSGSLGTDRRLRGRDPSANGVHRLDHSW